MKRDWIIRSAAAGVVAAVLIADPAAMFGQSRMRGSRETERRGQTTGSTRASTASAATTESPTTLPDDSRERLDLLVRRNIFLQSRRPARTTRTAEERPPEPRQETRPVVREQPNPGRDFALRGVAVNGDKRTAFLEDMRSKSAIPVNVGDLVAGSRIVAIELDYIEIESRQQQQRSRIEVGQDLTGAKARVVYVPGLERRTGTATIAGQQRRGGDDGGRGRNRGNRGGGFNRGEEAGGPVVGRGNVPGGAPAGAALGIPGGPGGDGGFDGPAIIIAPPDFDFVEPANGQRFDTPPALPVDPSREEALRQRRMRELQGGDDY